MNISTKITLSIFTLSIGAICLTDYTAPVHGNQNGPPAGRTGSPSDGSNCTVGCHTGTPTTQAGIITSNIPVTGYVPGQTYTITATVVSNPTVKFGFQISPQDASGNLKGTLVVTNSTETQLVGSGKYIEHKLAGTPGTGSRTWTFDWIAPVIGSGDVTFYGAFNITNNSGTNAGDQIRLSSTTVSEDVSSSINENSNSIAISVFPNPVTEYMNVSYELKNNSKVNAKLFSVTGQEIIEFFNEEQNAGTQSKKIELNPSISSGTYFLSIDMNGVKSIKKIIVQ